MPIKLEVAETIRARMTMSEQPAYLPFAKPSITDRERQAVLDVLDSGWLTTGPQSRRFEEEFAAKVGVRHAIALNSATAALHLALEAIGAVLGTRGKHSGLASAKSA